jgi:uncharacterized protein (DUF488 family)
MPSFDVLSIGHSNIPAERFVAMLQDGGAGSVADVRSVPLSRHFPWFSKNKLSARLASVGISYVAMGDHLGGRPRDTSLYRDGVADYDAMALQAYFRVGLDRVEDAAARSRVCLMCAERDPLDCHRFLLVARGLAERGLALGHILHDGTIEAHAATEARLLASDGEDCDLFAAGQSGRLAAAYRRRAQRVAYRQDTARGARVTGKR